MSAPPRVPLVRAPGDAFSPGYTPILRAGEDLFGLDFGIQVLDATAHEETHRRESVWVLLAGEATLEWEGGRARARRISLFDDPPSVLHLGPGAAIRVETYGERTEWAVARTDNRADFTARYFAPESIAPEYRGAGLAQGTCERNVRLVFDRTTRPESNLVVGEVVNYPGRWSSYPPHHHPQPEIYHYRFTHAQGYGHAELGEEVFRVRDGDTLRIPGGRTHAQVAAPGYGMYYLWIVRHLDAAPYTGFEYAPQHTWMLDPRQQGWEPRR